MWWTDLKMPLPPKPCWGTPHGKELLVASENEDGPWQESVKTEDLSSTTTGNLRLPKTMKVGKQILPWSPNENTALTDTS